MRGEVIRVLLADNDEPRAEALRDLLETRRDTSFEITEVTALGEAVDALMARRFDAVISALKLTDSQGLPTLAILQTYAEGAPVVVLAESADDPVALRALQQGACDLIPRDQLYAMPVVRSIRYAVERSRTEGALRASEERYRSLFQHSRDAIYVADGEGRLQELNVAALELFGYRAEELVGREVRELFAEAADHDRLAAELTAGRAVREMEVRLRTKTGRDLWCLVAAAPRLDGRGEVTGSQGIAHDITERKVSELRLQHDALHDALTGLPNRALLMDRLERAVRRTSRDEEATFALLFLDLDRFKGVNDTLGHGAGDQVLRRTGGLLRSCVREVDTVARLGGDEFVVLLEDVGEVGEAVQVAARMLALLDRPYRLAGREFFTTASIGICWSAPGEDAAGLLRHADVAMYRAKSRGGGRYELFDPEMQRAAVSKLEVESDLRTALARDELILHYQPILSCDSGRTIGFEALARWNHPRRGMLAPDSFIPVAEETALIVPLGFWALRSAAGQLRRWRESGRASDDVFMSVNVSPRQFLEPDLVPRIAAVLEEEGVPPKAVMLEVTESALMQDPQQAVARLSSLRALGVRLCLDDFGTGYSSLAHLRRFPLNALKVDRSFIARLESRRDFELVATITALARTLGIDAVIEGVETPQQLARVRRLRAREMQGFLFSRPVEPALAATFLDAARRELRVPALATVRACLSRLRERWEDGRGRE